ncbi:unnamed protein product, partial [marine sediment metagenome]
VVKSSKELEESVSKTNKELDKALSRDGSQAGKLSGEIKKLTKSFVTVTSVAASFAFTIDKLNKLLKIFKENLDIQQAARANIQTLKDLARAATGYADTSAKTEAQLEKLSNKALKRRKADIKSAQESAIARRNLLAAEGDEAGAGAAQREFLELSASLSQLEPLLISRNEVAQQQADVLETIKAEETAKIKTQLDAQIANQQAANKQLADLQQQRADVAKEFADLITRINAPADKPVEDLTVLDPIKSLDLARAAQAAGEFQKALDLSRQAGEQIEAL